MNLNMIFSVFIIPICLAIITNLFRQVYSVNIVILFISSFFLMLIGIGIIHIGFDATNFLRTLNDGVETAMMFFIISVATIAYIVSYFIVYIFIRILR